MRTAAQRASRSGRPGRPGPLDLMSLMRSRIRDVPDWPNRGVLFKDITPLLADPVAFGGVVDEIVAYWGRGTVDKVVGIEARGFLVAAPVAYHFGAGIVPVRKKGKLPVSTYASSYDLEYGQSTLEVHQDAFHSGDRVVIVDDVLATGGTALAAIDLVERSSAEVVGVSVLMEIEALQGRAKLEGRALHALLKV